MNTSTQLKALIRNLSKEKSVQAEIILRNFMLERLLERISLSPFRDKFILKGGMLVAAMVGIDTRSTMDMDATLSRSTTSTRMRDYYDVYILTTLREQDINWDLFSEAFKNTAERRGSYTRLLETGHDNMWEIEQSQVLAELWSRYQQKNSYAADLTWMQVIASTRMLYHKAFGKDADK
ncbi:MAG: hypothetical protein HPY66_2074 [Firmicutes bacterium]|nr:hypothetical protein [Bacillota bacterium]